MARIRTVKPELFRHEGLYELEAETGLPVRLAFAGLFTASDRGGYFKWRPRELKLDVMPYDMIDFSRVMDALGTRGFLVKYRVADEWFGLIPTFTKHQVINNRERASDLPQIEDAEEFFQFSTNENNDLLSRQPRVIDASATREGNAQGEGKGREGKGTGREREVGKPTKDDFEESFGVFWKLYPNKVGKPKALAKWLQIKPGDEMFAEIIRGLGMHCQSLQWTKDNGEFIPHPTTWLNRQGWNDEVKPNAGQANPGTNRQGRPSLVEQVRQRGRELEAERGGQAGYGSPPDGELPPAWLETGGIDWDGEFARIDDADGSLVGTND